MVDALRKFVRGFEYDFLKLDARSAAAFRIAFATWLLYDLGGRWRAAHELYGGGWVDPHFLRETSNGFAFSLLWMVPSPTGVSVVLALIATAYVGLLIGYRARWMTLLSLIGFCSLMHGNRMTRDGGESITVLMLLWSLFLNLDDRWALAPGRAKRVESSTGILAARLQIIWIYISGGLTKTGLTWHTGTALYYIFRYHQMGTDFGRLGESLSQPLLEPLSNSVVFVETLAPLLLLLPVKAPWPRRAGIVALLALQLGIGLTVNTGFQLLLTASLLLFLQARDWEDLAKLAFQWRTPAFLRPQNRAVEAASRPVRVLWEGFAIYLLAIQLGLALFPYRVRAMPPGGWSFIKIVPSLQYWDFFAPDAPQVDGWWSIYGTLVDGREIDLFTAEPFRREEPPRIWSEFGRFKFKIFEVLTFEAFYANQKGKPLFDVLARFQAKHPGTPFREVRFSYFSKTIPTPEKWTEGARPTFTESTIWLYRVPEAQWAHQLSNSGK